MSEIQTTDDLQRPGRFVFKRWDGHAAEGWKMPPGNQWVLMWCYRNIDAAFREEREAHEATKAELAKAEKEIAKRIVVFRSIELDLDEECEAHKTTHERVLRERKAHKVTREKLIDDLEAAENELAALKAEKPEEPKPIEYACRECGGRVEENTYGDAHYLCCQEVDCIAHSGFFPVAGQRPDTWIKKEKT